MSKQKTQHTPGPWKAKQDRLGHHVVSGGRVVADVGLSADAALIASAPSLLAAAEAVLDVVVVFPAGGAVVGDVARFRVALQRLADAVSAVSP